MTLDKPNAAVWKERIDKNPEKYGVKASDVSRGRKIIRDSLAAELVEDAKRIKREKKEMGAIDDE